MRTKCLSILKESKRKNLIKQPGQLAVVRDLMEKFDLTMAEASAFIAIFGKMWDEDSSFYLKELKETYSLTDREYMRLLIHTKSLHKKGLVIFERERGRSTPINPTINIDEQPWGQNPGIRSCIATFTIFLISLCLGIISLKIWSNLITSRNPLSDNLNGSQMIRIPFP